MTRRWQTFSSIIPLWRASPCRAIVLSNTLHHTLTHPICLQKSVCPSIHRLHSNAKRSKQTYFGNQDVDEISTSEGRKVRHRDPTQMERLMDLDGLTIMSWSSSSHFLPSLLVRALILSLAEGVKVLGRPEGVLQVLGEEDRPVFLWDLKPCGRASVSLPVSVILYAWARHRLQPNNTGDAVQRCLSGY